MKDLEKLGKLLPDKMEIESTSKLGDVDPKIMDDFLEKVNQLKAVKDKFLKKRAALFEDGSRIMYLDKEDKDGNPTKALFFWKPLEDNRFISFTVAFDFDNV